MKNKTILMNLFRILIPATLLVVMYFLSGCGSKKKIVEKEQVKVETVSDSKIAENSQEETENEIVKVIVSEQNSVSVQENFIGEVADSSKDATLTIENLNGTKVYRYTNFKNVSSGATNSVKSSKDSIDQNTTNKSIKLSTKTIETSDKTKTKSKTVNKDLEVKRGFPWYWIIIGLLLYGVLSYFGNSLNPMKWLR